MAESRFAGPRGLVLARICAACLDRLPIDEATVAIASGPDQWGPAHATSPAVARLEEFAFTTGEGPSVDVLRGRTPILFADLQVTQASARWPAWTAAALDQQIRAVHAFPVQAGAITAGALTLYARTRLALDAHQLAAALRLADDTFVGILDLLSGVLDGDGHLDETLQRDVSASLLRADVHSAAGMVMGQTGLPIDQALARLRAHAFAVDRPLSEVAADVLNRRHRFRPEQGQAD